MELDIIKNSTTWNDASASINNNFAKVKTALEQGGGGGGNANVLVINSDVDFNLSEGFNTTGGIINDKNITYAKVQEAVDNGYTIALKEPSGNISYCIKAEYAVPNQNGEKRIIIFFSWRIGDEQYAATLYVGLDSSLSYAKWKLDLATKDYVDDAETAAKQYADDNKVAKVEGKQLSTEDFTTELKQKLDGLTNYDDADVRLAITALQNNLDAIVNGDATSAIDSIQEILAFLSTITDTQTLAGIVADLKQYVDDKVASGGGGITEETEVYIGEEEPTDDGAKLWIDPTGTPSQPSGRGHILVYWYKLTDEQKAHNATAFQQILNELKAGRFPQVIVANSEIAAANSMGIVGLYGGHPATEIAIIDPDSQAAEMLGKITMGIRFSDTGGEKYLYITPDGVEHNYSD